MTGFSTICGIVDSLIIINVDRIQKLQGTQGRLSYPEAGTCYLLTVFHLFNTA